MENLIKRFGLQRSMAAHFGVWTLLTDGLTRIPACIALIVALLVVTALSGTIAPGRIVLASPVPLVANAKAAKTGACNPGDSDEETASSHSSAFWSASLTVGKVRNASASAWTSGSRIYGYSGWPDSPGGTLSSATFNHRGQSESILSIAVWAGGTWERPSDEGQFLVLTFKSSTPPSVTDEWQLRIGDQSYDFNDADYTYYQTDDGVPYGGNYVWEGDGPDWTDDQDIGMTVTVSLHAPTPDT